jgi:hypothetical protein
MLRRFDVFRLGALVAPAKQNDDRPSPFLKVDTVAGAVVDTELADAFANRLGVACVPLSQPIQSRSDHRTGPLILEPLPPLSKRLCLLQLKQL